MSIINCGGLLKGKLDFSIILEEYFFFGLWGLFRMALPEAGKGVGSGAGVGERWEPSCNVLEAPPLHRQFIRALRQRSGGGKVMVWAVQRSPSDVWVSTLQTWSEFKFQECCWRRGTRPKTVHILFSSQLYNCWEYLCSEPPPPLSVCTSFRWFVFTRCHLFDFHFSFKLHCHSSTQEKSHSSHLPFEVHSKF